MIAGLVRSSNLRTRGEAAKRETVGNALRSDQNVWINAIVFDGKHLAGTAET